MLLKIVGYFEKGTTILLLIPQLCGLQVKTQIYQTTISTRATIICYYCRTGSLQRVFAVFKKLSVLNL